MITEKQIEDTIYQLYKQAAIVLGDDVKCANQERSCKSNCRSST